MKNYFCGTLLQRLFYSVIITIFTGILACSSDRGKSDVVVISGVNEFITNKDMRRGVRRSTNSISHVSMSHQMHEDSDISCVTCHHKKANPERIKKCVYCHKGIEGSSLFHSFCVGCHKENNNGPESCDECHRESSEHAMTDELMEEYSGQKIFTTEYHPAHNKANISCTICHHDVEDASKKDDKKKCSEKDGEECPEDHEKACKDCHSGESKMKIMHVFCKDCHRSKGRGPLTCKACHKSTKPVVEKRFEVITLKKTGHRKPPIVFNHRAHIEKYNTECIDCHHKKAEKMKCASKECHQSKDKGKIINLKGAFHQQCHDCHRKTKGPKACSRCHVR